MAAGNWVDWNTGDLVTAASFQDIQDSIVFIYADETAANAALTNKVQGTIFYDTTADVLKAWDGSAWISAETGDISAVTAGDGLSGGGSSGDVTLDLDLNELTAASVDVANDSIAIVDATDNSSKKESIADLATAMADGSTITASAGVLSAASSGGLTEADNWRLTTFVSSNTNPVTNWEREDSLLQGSYVGTGMTESSGIWTFPATGIYLVNLFASLVQITSGATCGLSIYATNDGGSTYTSNIAVIAAKGTDEYSNQAISTFVDITDTSLCKIKVVVTFGGSGQLAGNTTQNLTTLTFLKLGDT